MRHRRDLRAPWLRRARAASPDHGGGAPPPWSRRHRPVHGRPSRDDEQPAGDRRPRRRRPAARERGRPLLGDAERRDLQLRRAAGRARRPRPPLRDPERHRGDRAGVRRVGPGLPRADERRLRLRGLGPARAGALPRARPLRRPSAVPRRARGRPRLRLRDEGDPAPPVRAARARPRRARRDVHHLVHLTGRLVVPRHPGARPRPLPPRRPRRHPRGAAVVGPPLLGRRRRDAGRARRARGRAGCAARRRHALAPAGRRPRRRVPERRPRLVRHRRARARADGRDALQLRHRLRGSALRRERLPGSPHRLPRPRSDPRDDRRPRHRRASPADRGADGEADAPHRAVAAPAPLRRRPAGGPEGGHHRRGGGRALRRVRHLPREHGAPFLGAGARVRAPPAAAHAAERVHRQGPQALRRVPRRLLPQGPHRRRRPPLQPPAPLREHLAAARAPPGRRPGGGGLAGRPGRTPRGAPAVVVHGDDAARPRSVPGDHHLPERLPAPLAGRPDADGPFDRRSFPLPRLPRGRARGEPSRPAPPARARTRSTSCARPSSTGSRRRSPGGRSARTARRSSAPSSARTRPPTSASSSAGRGWARPGSSPRRPSRGSSASARPARRGTP